MKYQISFHNGQIVVLEASTYEEVEHTATEMAKDMGTSIINILDEVDAYR